MQAVDAGRPLRGWMAQQHGEVVLETRWQLELQWVLNSGRLQEHRLTGGVQR
jgi:hypothetical protein